MQLPFLFKIRVLLKGPKELPELYEPGSGAEINADLLVIGKVKIGCQVYICGNMIFQPVSILKKFLFAIVREKIRKKVG